MRRSRPPDEEILGAVAELVDDGFCERWHLRRRFPRLGEREFVKSLKALARRGLLEERRGPDGRMYVTLTPEGWERLSPGAPGSEAV